jgi:2-iminoacetate synthase
MTTGTNVKDWVSNVIRRDEIDKYLNDGKDFIDDDAIFRTLDKAKTPDKSKIRDILQKSLEIRLLDPFETASLINVTDPEIWEEMFETAGAVKRKVYDNRIVTFAPLYCSNLCVNNCLYCAFRKDNTREKRRILSIDEVRAEARSLASMGHKRLIMVYGEHPSSSADYIAETMEAVYGEEVKTRRGTAQIRRANINAAPMAVDDMKKLWKVGIGTYQVFQETYHHDTYAKMHPSGIKSDYRWRLYALHRALEAGIDDVAIGALFGIFDWRFEVMGLVAHSADLEEKFGIGAHTVSFPRLNPAEGCDVDTNSPYRVSDEDFKKLVTILRLSIPHAGLIITARESAKIRREVIPLGCTQTDASTRIGIGSYSEQYNKQEMERQQFILGDTRSLDEVIREFTEMGMITSFCTAGYRCGRTGDKIMKLLRTGVEGKFCKLNAVLTFREWLDDFASDETKAAGEKLLAQEMEAVKNDPFFKGKPLLEQFLNNYERIVNGERDVFI